jgi:hypothetical protein
MVSHHVARVVLADGTVFFDTRNPLVPEDVNRRRDVYTWTPGDARPRLVTTGIGDADVTLRDVSPDGTDVYVATTARLVSQDRDDNRDIYTARRDGGLWSQNPSEPPAECAGQACQAPQAPAPAVPGIASSAYAGLGNVAATARSARPALSVARTRSVRGVAVALRVKVDGAGAIRVSGAALRSARRTTGKAGTYRVAVTLNARGKRALRRAGKLRAGVTVAFTRKDERSASRRLTVTFTQPRATAAGRAGAKGGR